MLSDKKKNLAIALFIIFTFVIVLVIALFIKPLTPKTKVRQINTNLKDLGFQLDFPERFESDIYFLTYRMTALAKTNIQSGKTEILTEQIFDGVSDATWFTNEKSILIESKNDPDLYSKVKGYKVSDDYFQYLKYNVDKKELVAISPGMDVVFVLNNKMFGFKNKTLYRLQGDKWIKTTKEYSYKDLVFSSKNKYFGIKEDDAFKIYNDQFDLEKSYKLPENVDEKDIRLFDNLDLSLFKETELTYCFDNKTINISIPRNEGLIFGKNNFLYTKNGGKDLYTFNVLERKSYLTNINVKEFELYNIFGLNENFAVYFDELKETSTLWDFNG